MLIPTNKIHKTTIDRYFLRVEGGEVKHVVHVVSMHKTQRNIDRVEQNSKITEFYKQKLLENMYETTPNAAYFVHDEELNTNLDTGEFIGFIQGTQIEGLAPFDEQSTLLQACELMEQYFDRYFYRYIENNLS